LRIVPPRFSSSWRRSLQFQRVHAADELLMYLLDQGWIAWETARVQIAHLLDQGPATVARALGIVLHRRANLVQSVQCLIDLALGIGGG